MIDSLRLQSAVWAITTASELVLVFLLFRRKAVANYPFFTAYLITAVLQSAALAQIHRLKGLDRETAWELAWGTQAVVTIMRSLAIVELARRIIGAYSGLWLLARRLFQFVALGVLINALILSKGVWQWLVLDGVRGFELAAAAVVVTMLLFARFYSLPMHPLPRALAIGFCMYSSFYVINYSLLKRTMQQYGVFWNFLSITAFLASLLIWISAAAKYVAAEDEVKPASIPPELYGKLSSEVNLRLYLLNRRLTLLLHGGERRP